MSRIERRAKREQARRLAKAAAKIAGRLNAPDPVVPPAKKGKVRLVRIPVARRQADMLIQAQANADRANGEVQVVAAALLAGYRGGELNRKGVRVNLKRIGGTQRAPVLEVEVSK